MEPHSAGVGKPLEERVRTKRAADACHVYGRDGRRRRRVGAQRGSGRSTGGRPCVRPCPGRRRAARGRGRRRRGHERQRRAPGRRGRGPDLRSRCTRENRSPVRAHRRWMRCARDRRPRRPHADPQPARTWCTSRRAERRRTNAASEPLRRDVPLRTRPTRRTTGSIPRTGCHPLPSSGVRAASPCPRSVSTWPIKAARHTSRDERPRRAERGVHLLGLPLRGVEVPVQDATSTLPTTAPAPASPACETDRLRRVRGRDASRRARRCRSRTRT